jgi:hypothetical protein
MIYRNLQNSIFKNMIYLMLNCADVKSEPVNANFAVVVTVAGTTPDNSQATKMRTGQTLRAVLKSSLS